MIIRAMTSEDVPTVSQIERECFSQPWSERGFLDAINNPDAFFWVAEEFSQIRGYLGMYRALDEGEITNVAAAVDFRGRGTGRQLVNKAIEYAKTNGMARIILEVRKSNSPAIALYLSCGFKKIGTRRDFYSFPQEDAEIMLWERERL